MHRRDVVRGLLGAPLFTSLACGGRRTDVAKPAGTLVGPSLERGHRLRENAPLHAWDSAPVEDIDVAIVGAGAAGLSAAWRLKRLAHDSFAVLDLEPTPGGTARSGRNALTRYPLGAHYLPVPHDQPLLRTLLVELGAIENGEPAERVLVREPDERVFVGGYWYRGLYPYAGATADDLQQLARFRDRIVRLANARDGQNRRLFTIPLSRASRDPSVLALDAIPASAWCRENGFTSSRLRFMLDYGCRDDYGLRLTETSAWAMLFYWASRIPDGEEQAADVLTWPEGNAALIDHMSSAIGERVRCGALVAHVAAEEGRVRVAYYDESDERRVLLAKRAIVAVPRFVAKRIVHALRDEPADASEGDVFRYGGWMVANLTLDGRPRSRGFPLCWDNVLVDGPSVGYVTATHQSGRDHGPVTLTYYQPMTHDDEREGRQLLFEASYEEWRESILLDLSRAHLELPVRSIEVCRWGHAMIQPRVGFHRSEARLAAQRPREGVHFANSDLSGVALFEEAFDHGTRAADEVLAALRDPERAQGEHG